MYKIIIIFTSLLNYVNSQIRGVSLGSLYVLEPFITPHLFYQFLGEILNKIISYKTHKCLEINNR